MNKKNIINIFFILINLSLLLPLSQSRLISTWDFPSKYTISTDYLNSSPPSIVNSSFDFNIEGGLAFSYEHRLIKNEKFNFYLGTQMMLGKKTDITLAFHSIYLMPTYIFNDKNSLFFRLGYSNLNSDDNALPASASMLGLGYEIKISEDWALNFSNTWHQTGSKLNIIEVCPDPMFLDVCYSESMNNKLNYNKFSVSLVYEIKTKEERKSSSKSRGRNK